MTEQKTNEHRRLSFSPEITWEGDRHSERLVVGFTLETIGCEGVWPDLSDSDVLERVQAFAAELAEELSEDTYDDENPDLCARVIASEDNAWTEWVA